MAYGRSGLDYPVSAGVFITMNVQRVHYAWWALMGLTLLSYLAGQAMRSGTMLVDLIVVMAFIKGIVIIREFMELREVAMLWQVIMIGWLVTVCSVIAIVFGISG